MFTDRLPHWTPTHQAVASSIADALGVADPPTVVGTIDWGAFERICAVHQVGSLVRRSDLPTQLGAPAQVPARLADAARRQAERRLRNQAALQRGLLALQGAGIEAIAIKGLPLAVWAYGDAGSRASADVDLWVPPADVSRAIRALEAIGFVLKPLVFENDVVPIRADTFDDLTASTYPGLFEVSLTEHGAGIDLHWRLFQNPALLPLDPWADPSLVQHVDVGNLVVPTLAPEPAWWYMALHGTKDRWFQLKWLADVPAVLRAAPELADDEHRRRAHEQGAGRATETALALSHELFGRPSEQPSPVADRIGSRVLLAACRASVGSPPQGTPSPTMATALRVVARVWTLNGTAAYRTAALRQMAIRGGRTYVVRDPGAAVLAVGVPSWANRTVRRAVRRAVGRSGIADRFLPGLLRYRLAAEAAAELTAATIRLRMTPSSRLVDRLGTPSVPAPIDAIPAAEQAARSDSVVLGAPVGPRAQLAGAEPAHQVGWAVRGMGDRLPWHPTCLPRALAAQRMLTRRAITAEIHLGVPDARLRAAHAWVVVGDEVVVGGTRRPFTSVGAFTAGPKRAAPAAATERLL